LWLFFCAMYKDWLFASCDLSEVPVTFLRTEVVVETYL
jgi:hypothetical protein